MKYLSKTYPYLWQLFGLLLLLRKSYKGYEEAMEEFYEVNSIMGFFENIDFINSSTRDAAKEFETSWYNYIQNHTYSSDPIFVYLDKSFIKILENELHTFLESLIEDIRTNNFEDKFEFDELIKIETPDKDAIIKRISFLYKKFILS